MKKLMKKFIFYSQANYSKLEKALENAERSGWTLKHRKFKYWFEFSPSSPKNVRYFVSYNFLKDTGMWETEMTLKKSLGANPILKGSETIYRITDENCDLQVYETERKKYLKSVFWQKGLLGFSMLMFSSAGIIYAIFNKIFDVKFYLLAVFGVLMFTYLIINIVRRATVK